MGGRTKKKTSAEKVWGKGELGMWDREGERGSGGGGSIQLIVGLCGLTLGRRD